MSTTSHPQLPPALAFVVQLAPPATDTPAAFRGRVEHIASGATCRFGSTGELLKFLELACGAGPLEACPPPN